MDFVDYVKTLKRYWLLILVITILVGSMAVVGNSVGKTRYSSKMRLVVGPAPTIQVDSDIADVLSALDRRSIVSTLAQVASSDALRDRSARVARFKVPQDFDTTAVVLAQANAVQVSVTGEDKGSVQKMAATLGAQSERFFEKYYRVYDVQVIDNASVPKETRPAVVSVAIIGAVAGLVIGFLLALAAQRLRDAKAA